LASDFTAFKHQIGLEASAGVDSWRSL